jgi:hypothetical protein
VSRRHPSAVPPNDHRVVSEPSLVLAARLRTRLRKKHPKILAEAASVALMTALAAADGSRS